MVALLTVDEEAQAAYLSLDGAGKVARTIQVSAEVLVDVDAEGQPVGVEVLSLTPEVPVEALIKLGVRDIDLGPLLRLGVD